MIQTLVLNQGAKSVHLSFVGMPLCSQRQKLFPVVQHFLMSPVFILPFLSLSPSDIHPSSNPKQLMLSGFSLLTVSNVNNLAGLVGLPYVMWSAHFFVTHIQREKISSWNDLTVHVCCFMLARASTKTFVSRVRKTAEKIFVSRVTR